jgi:pimeloyl-ACP methyl ester carboxylesterase
MRSFTSHFLSLHGLRVHVRTWGDPTHPRLFLLHGWMDVSASFQFVVDELRRDWYVIAPDWRGFGLSDWAPGEYWFPDYLADLDTLLDEYSPDTPAILVGHSMGGNVAGLYAGIRPGRVAHLILAEGFGLMPTLPDQAPERYARWLDEARPPRSFRKYPDLAAVVAHLRRNSARLSEECARFLAPHWAWTCPDGSWVPAADPKHRRINPVLYRQEEVLACWRRITAPVLWIWGGDPDWMRDFAGDDAADWARRRAALANLSECRIEGSGHMMHHDNPAEFARAIESFLPPLWQHPAGPTPYLRANP